MQELLLEIQANNAAYEPLKRLRALCIQEPVAQAYRSLVWKLLLRVKQVDVERYVVLTARQESAQSEKIARDTKRTLQTSNFTSVVHEFQLTRLLNALANSGKFYVQGMNALVAPLIYTMSEPEAYFSALQLLEQTRTYFLPNLIGVHAGCQLAQTLLGKEDAELYQHLTKKNLSLQIISFSRIMSFYTTQQPLKNVLRLWDFLLSAGFQMNILVVVSELMYNRELILSARSPTDVINELNLTAVEEIIQMCQQMYGRLSADEKLTIASHVVDEEVCKQHVKKMFGGYM